MNPINTIKTINQKLKNKLKKIKNKIKSKNKRKKKKKIKKQNNIFIQCAQKVMSFLNAILNCLILL